MSTHGDVAEALAKLREVLMLVESGELECGPDQLAQLRGAVRALQVVVAQP
jgi:hypothetical protein